MVALPMVALLTVPEWGRATKRRNTNKAEEQKNGHKNGYMSEKEIMKLERSAAGTFLIPLPAAKMIVYMIVGELNKTATTWIRSWKKKVLENKTQINSDWLFSECFIFSLSLVCINLRIIYQINYMPTPFLVRFRSNTSLFFHRWEKQNGLHELRD